MYNYILDDTKAEYSVYINLISSPAGHYLSRRPYVISLIRELLSNTNLKGSRIVIEKNMGRAIGNSDVVLTNDNDNIYYALPLKSDVYLRFAKNRRPQTSNILTVILDRDSDGNFEVIDTWIGSMHPVLPGDESATEESNIYWKNHAFTQDAQLIQSKSVTKICPYSV